MQKLLLLALTVYLLVIPMAFLFHDAYSINVGGASSSVAPSSVLPVWQTILYLIVAMIFGLCVWFLIFKYAKFLHPHLQAIYTYFLIAVAMAVFFSFLLLDLGVPYDIVFFVLWIGGLMFYRRFKYQYFNLFTVFVCMIWGAYLGFAWTPILVYYAYILLCAYDLIAVFKSNFMMTLAKTMLTANVIPPAFIIDGSIKDMKAKLLQNKKTKARLLGGGDLIIPGALIATLYLYDNIWVALFLVVGAMVGLELNFRILKAHKVALPALPLLLGCQIAFFGLTLIPTSFIWIVLSPMTIVFVYQFIDRLALGQVKKMNGVVINAKT